MKLVIVESPAKAKTINKYLGNDYKVLASFGHIRDLPSKNGSVRPEEDFAMDYEITGQSIKHVKEINDAVKNSDEIILATDPDREGEAISWHVIEALKLRNSLKKIKKISRVVFHEITKNAVTKAIASPRDIDMDMVNSQQARRALDYLVGFNLSPILWRKLPGSRSAGRVQSVALRLICEREEEIEKFIQKEYWDIKADLKTIDKQDFTAKLVNYNGKKLEQFDIIDEKTAHNIKRELEQKSYYISKVEKKQSRRFPQPPFTTSSMQQEAARKLRFSAKKTMMVAQKLYEGINLGGETVGLITYMRTDSVSVSNEAIVASRKLIEANYGKNYLPQSPHSFKTKAKNTQEAHEAIRPTDVKKLPDSIQRFLDDDQLKLYDLIWKRMMASQMEAAVLDQVVAQIPAKDNTAIFKANGSSIAFDGFYKIYREGLDDSENDDEKILPPLKEKDDLSLNQIIPEQHFTKPPPRFTEASLVKKLEELGIGRPSTYASIISVLQDREYVILEKRRFVAQDRGRIVTAFLSNFFKKYVEYDFTAHLEDSLDDISHGKIDWKEVLRKFWKDFKLNIDEVEEQTITDVIRSLNLSLADYLFPKDKEGNTDRSCPACDDGRLSLKLGKFGAFLGCSNYPECKHTKQLSQSSEESDGGEKQITEDKMLGVDKNTSLDVILKKGPYGFYIQLGDNNTDKPKRVAIPKGVDIQSVNIEYASGLLSLPRQVGKHPETGKVVTAGIGRFGPYLRYDSKYTSLKDDDVLTIGINRAVSLIAENQAKNSNDPLKTLGKYPGTEKEIGVYSGRYGPYVKYEKINASLPKNLEVETITLEQAVELIDNKSKKPKKSKTKKQIII